MSIPQLADESGVDKGTISRFERGGDFRQATFVKVCMALGKNPREVYAILARLDEEASVPTADLNAYICEEHKHFHRWLEEILHCPEEKWKMGIAANLEAVRDRAIGISPAGPPHRRDISARRGDKIKVERKGNR